MKKAKTKQRFSLSAVVLAAALMVSGFASCSKSETELSPDGSRAISLSANVQGTTQTRAAVDGTAFPASINNVFRLTAYSGTAAPSNWAAPYFNDIQVNSGAASALTLVTKQYYPANGDKVYFYGYAPEATSLTAGTTSAPIANYTITGQEDIMVAKEVTGIAAATSGTQPQPTLAFTHKLMQLKFKIVKDASFEAGKKVTNIFVTNVKTSAKLNIGAGVLTFDGTANRTLWLPIPAGSKDEITAGGTEMNGCIMLEPVGANGTITLKVIADGVTYDNISVTLSGTNNGKAGTSHLITLTFKRTGITPSATITDWKSPVDKDINIDGDGLRVPAIGDFINGGIVYWVDGANYKVFSLDQGSGLKWAANNTYYIAGAQSDTDGQKNVDIMKAYSANTGTNTTTGVFATDFPAAGFCESKNVGGVTGWYLPARNELSTFRAAYYANKAVLDNTITDYGGTSFDVVDVSDHLRLWTSNEYSSERAYSYNFTGSTWFNSSRNYQFSVRCIKHIVPPPPPPAVGDYYYSDGSYSAALDAGKTETGIVYYVDPADPTKFKVVSLEEASTTLGWAESDTYVVSGARSDTDGKANSDAIKAYYDTEHADGRITTTFEIAFPAAYHCYNYAGKGGTDAQGTWYLPAKNEVQYLWCAYNGVAPAIWLSGKPNFTADATAQADFNKYLTAAGGTNIGKSYYLSSSEIINTSSSWFVNLDSGSTGSYDKTGTSRVRCVRDI